MLIFCIECRRGALHKKPAAFLWDKENCCTSLTHRRAAEAHFTSGVKLSIVEPPSSTERQGVPQRKWDLPDNIHILTSW